MLAGEGLEKVGRHEKVGREAVGDPLWRLGAPPAAFLRPADEALAAPVA